MDEITLSLDGVINRGSGWCFRTPMNPGKGISQNFLSWQGPSGARYFLCEWNDSDPDHFALGQRISADVKAGDDHYLSMLEIGCPTSNFPVDGVTESDGARFELLRSVLQLAFA